MFLVDEEHYEKFCNLLHETVYKKSDFFLKEGEECQYLGFLKTGFMRTFYINEGGEGVNFNFHFDNYFFTDYESILCHTKSKMNIKAVKDSEVLLLHKDDLQKLYKKDAYWQEFGRKMTEVIYLNAKKKNRRIIILFP